MRTANFFCVHGKKKNDVKNKSSKIKCEHWPAYLRRLQRWLKLRAAAWMRESSLQLPMEGPSIEILIKLSTDLSARFARDGVLIAFCVLKPLSHGTELTGIVSAILASTMKSGKSVKSKITILHAFKKLSGLTTCKEYFISAKARRVLSASNNGCARTRGCAWFSSATLVWEFPLLPHRITVQYFRAFYWVCKVRLFWSGTIGHFFCVRLTQPQE